MKNLPLDITVHKVKVALDRVGAQVHSVVLEDAPPKAVRHTALVRLQPPPLPWQVAPGQKVLLLLPRPGMPQVRTRGAVAPAVAPAAAVLRCCGAAAVLRCCGAAAEDCARAAGSELMQGLAMRPCLRS